MKRETVLVIPRYGRAAYSGIRPCSCLPLILARFDNSQNVKMRPLQDTSKFREFPKRRNEIYFLRFFSRVRSSLIDIVGSFLLSSINFQKVEEV